MPEELEGPVWDPPQGTVDYTLVDANGRVAMRGSSMAIPQMPGLTPVDGLPPDLTDNHYWTGAAWAQMPARPGPHHVFDWVTKTWSDPRTLADRKAAVKAAVTAKRWAVETGGLTLPNGVRVKTEKADQDRITAVLVNMSNAGIEVVDFKADSGWVTLSHADLQGVASAIALHVQACFSAERYHHEAVDALSSQAAVDAYDINSVWPSN